LTDVTPPKVVPVITTDVPTVPWVGEKPVMPGFTLKFELLVAVPPGVVTLILPAIAVAGTVAVIWVGEFSAKLALCPLKVTAVAPPKFVPITVTTVPTGPLVGEKLETVGAGMTVKLLALDADPPDVVTVIGPVVAPDGTVAVIWVEEFTVKLALVPLNLTELAPVNPVPVTTTVAPTPPVGGEKPEITGVTRKLLVLVAVPPAVVTLIFPVVAGGTVAVIWVAEFTL
jgi:hypothetical protein